MNEINNINQIKVGMLLEIHGSYSDKTDLAIVLLDKHGRKVYSGPTFYGFLDGMTLEGEKYDVKITKVYGLRDISGMYKLSTTNRTLLWDIEKVVDWSEVAIDTPIYVSDNSIEYCETPRHFAKYEDGKIYAWANGSTSFTAEDGEDGEYVTEWKYAKLAK